MPKDQVGSSLEKSISQRVLCWLFSIIYRRWLWEDWYKEYATPLKVKGWRTALVGYGRDLGMRKTITPCFWWFK